MSHGEAGPTSGTVISRRQTVSSRTIASTARCSARYSLRSASRARSIGSMTRSSIGWPATSCTLLSSRAQLVDMRRDLGTKLRGVLETFGKIVGKVGGRAFEARVREPAAGEAGLEEAVSALLAVRERLERQVEALEARILGFARRSDPCRRLMTIPGVGDRVRQAGVDSSAFEVAIGHAAWGGIWAGSGSAAGGASSAMASTCM